MDISKQQEELQQAFKDYLAIIIRLGEVISETMEIQDEVYTLLKDQMELLEVKNV